MNILDHCREYLYLQSVIQDYEACRCEAEAFKVDMKISELRKNMVFQVASVFFQGFGDSLATYERTAASYRRAAATHRKASLGYRKTARLENFEAN